MCLISDVNCFLKEIKADRPLLLLVSRYRYMINGILFCSKVKISDFDRLFSFDAYLLNFFFKFHTNSVNGKLKA